MRLDYFEIPISAAWIRASSNSSGNSEGRNSCYNVIAQDIVSNLGNQGAINATRGQSKPAPFL